MTAADDGYSGLRFDRPEFMRLLRDIECGRIRTVLTKDLSRLGRDQIYTAYYYQIHFPQRGVRYIAVAEGLDTAAAGAAGALLPFLAAANDFYTADISRKVRAALTARKKEGKFIGSKAPFGYEKDLCQPGHLLPDGRAAPVVQAMFTRYLQVGSVRALAKELTRDGVPTPSRYDTGGPAGEWSATMVRRILTTLTYAGHLTQNRREKINYKVSKRRNLPEDEWITVRNTHPGIVGQELFDQVGQLLRVRGYHGRGQPAGHLLTGLACCADCGGPMTYIREGGCACTWFAKHTASWGGQMDARHTGCGRTG